MYTQWRIIRYRISHKMVRLWSLFKKMSKKSVLCEIKYHRMINRLKAFLNLSINECSRALDVLCKGCVCIDLLHIIWSFIIYIYILSHYVSCKGHKHQFCQIKQFFTWSINEICVSDTKPAMSLRNYQKFCVRSNYQGLRQVITPHI